MKKSFGFVKKVLGFGKKNLYIGIAFLVVVGLLSLFIFSGAMEGFDGEIAAINSTQVATLTTAQVAKLTFKHGISDGGKGGL